MRLRYLHLPRCGPLTDTAIVFGREDLIDRTLDLPRKGSLNFVVGVNGSGKSTLLRALYQIFRALKNRKFPTFPFTLAWDFAPSGDIVSAVLHAPENKKDAYFVAIDHADAPSSKSGWILTTTALKSDYGTAERGENALGSYLQAHLPKRLIAYTSGADDPWLPIDHPTFRPVEEDEGQYQTEDERPPGWSMDQEWREEQPIRISNVLAHYAPKASSTTQTLPAAGPTRELTNESVERLRQELEELERVRKKALPASLPGGDRLDESYFRIRARHLRYAGVTLGLWQTAKELAGKAEEHDREAFRKLLLQQRGPDEKPKHARRVLNEIDWFWPTHLSITYRDTDDRVSLRQRQELLCLVALADEVIAQPRGRQRAVFYLGPSGGISLTEKLKGAFPFGISNSAIEIIAKRVDGCKTMAEAILRVLSSDTDFDSTPIEVFTRLRDWERTGLLENLTLTVKRLHCTVAADGEPDETIVTYDQLSDGEQMLLGRMGLLFLLRGQHGSLLLLDEPETHFNDVWKREIVEMIDMSLLNSTAANVLVATHTSIALTDAFAAEVTVLDKNDGQTTARGVTGGLFGTDPGEVAMNLFRADSSIGSRSVEILDQLLKTEWKGRETVLEAILNVLGSSFHRAELRAILKQLRGNPDGPASA
jgi:ABC-type molybdenum transport system ATPase subunit/photorepair protein PhrA